MSEFLQRIGQIRIVPVISLDDAADATPLGNALVGSGLPIAEITFRTAAAEQSIRTLAGRPDLLVGAGTVLNVETAKRAVGKARNSSSRRGLIPRWWDGAWPIASPFCRALPRRRISKWLWTMAWTR